jgi:hypothetical protein
VVVLQVLNGAFEAFDGRHLCPSYRDYLCNRARHLCYAILGPQHHDIHKLSVSWGKGKKSGTHIETQLLYRVLCNIDFRDHFAKKHGTWGIEGCFGTDDIENFFSELTRRAGGYMPSCEAALQMAGRAEAAAQLLWDTTWKQWVSKRKRYTVHQRTTRAQWNDGERVPTFWSLERELAFDLVERNLASLAPIAQPTVRAPKRMKHEGEKQATDSQQSVRLLQKRTKDTRASLARGA